ncbi:MAG: hypothetical protein EBT18_09845 [Gammaproteobacteria bacterium]|nr:hypothetical protein [Gammaproteobacteria bacterium]
MICIDMRNPASSRSRIAQNLLFFGVAALVGSLHPVVKAQVLDDSANVKILSAQSQTLLINHQYFEDMLRGFGLPEGPDDIREEYSSQCGSVSIGNNFASNQLGTDITVIIVGDILNVGNTCSGG